MTTKNIKRKISGWIFLCWHEYLWTYQGEWQFPHHMKYGLEIVIWPGMPGLMLTPSGFCLPPMPGPGIPTIPGLSPIIPGTENPGIPGLMPRLVAMLMLVTICSDRLCLIFLEGLEGVLCCSGLLLLFSLAPSPSSFPTWEQEDMCDGQWACWQG